MKDKWHIRWMGLAQHVSTWSKDPSCKIGAVAIDPIFKKTLAMGWNGFPRGIKDSHARYADREVKLKLVVHAEMNVIYNATYTGTSLAGAYLYVWGLPACCDCAKGIIQVGIKKVFISAECLNRSTLWYESWEKTKNFFNEAEVEWEVI